VIALIFLVKAHVRKRDRPADEQYAHGEEWPHEDLRKNLSASSDAHIVLLAAWAGTTPRAHHFAPQCRCRLFARQLRKSFLCALDLVLISRCEVVLQELLLQFSRNVVQLRLWVLPKFPACEEPCCSFELLRS